MNTESLTEIDVQKAITVHTKVKSVLRLLQGENLDQVANELGVSTERLVRWKERFIDGGRAGLLRRRTDESARLQRRREKLVQWTVLVIGLLFTIWLVTRMFSGIVQSGA